MQEKKTAPHTYDEGILIEKIGHSDQDFSIALTYLLPQLSSSAVIPDVVALDAILNDKNISVFAAKLKTSAIHHDTTATLDSQMTGDAKIVGMITICYLNLLTGRIALIEDVVVDNSARKLGVGKALVATAITDAQKRNVKHIELTSRPQRVAANKLYEKMGFVRRETNVWRYKNDSYVS